MFGQLWRNLPEVTKNLIIINLLVFVASLVMQGQGIHLNRIFGLYYPESENFAPYQVITSMFSHGSIGHIFFNMFALFMFGSQLEKVWGPKRFLFFYFVTGIGASVLHLSVQYFEFTNMISDLEFPIMFGDALFNNKQDVVDFINTEGINVIASGRNFVGEFGDMNALFNTPTVGASGAIYGLLLGFAMLFPNMELMLIFLPIPIKAKYFVPVLMAIELFMGVNRFEWDNIAHFAHLGGALFGFIIIKIWQRQRNNFY